MLLPAPLLPVAVLEAEDVLLATWMAPLEPVVSEPDPVVVVAAEKAEEDTAREMGVVVVER